MISKNPLAISVKTLMPNIAISDIVDSGQAAPSDSVESQLPNFTDEIGGKGKLE